MQENTEIIETEATKNAESGSITEQVTADVARLKIVMVNVYFVGEPGGKWVLVDAGLAMSAFRIKAAAEELFGEGAKPECIVLTHAHFDHVGALEDLADEWNVPIYAHRLEMPYLTGKSDYPPPDPTVGGGAMASSSFLFPKGPIDMSGRVEIFPKDGTIPGMEEWKIIETPGHSPGHVSFFRERDRLLIAGDAIVTAKQESFMAVVSQHQELHAPPMHFTPDYQNAEKSVKKILDLQPSIAATGHGIPMHGDHLTRQLTALAENFRELGMPKTGRYVDEPAITDETGVIYVPPPVETSPQKKLALGLTMGVGVGLAIALLSRDKKKTGKPFRFNYNLTDGDTHRELPKSSGYELPNRRNRHVGALVDNNERED